MFTPIATNIRNGNPATDAIEDLLETRTDKQGTLQLTHLYTTTRHALTVQYADGGLNAGTLANVKWRTDRGQTCPIANPTIENFLAYAAANS